MQNRATALRRRKANARKRTRENGKKRNGGNDEKTWIHCGRQHSRCLAASVPAHAQDTLKIAIGQINNWENQAPTLGQDAGIFKKHNLVIEAVGTQGAGETIQAVISGSADLGAGVGVAGAMRAFSKGAPVRILLPAFTGTGDLYWYVKADSPIKSLKDTTDKNTIAYSTNGSSSHNIVASFTQELGARRSRPRPAARPER